jgi:hypothetical protein
MGKERIGRVTRAFTDKSIPLFHHQGQATIKAPALSRHPQLTRFTEPCILLPFIFDGEFQIGTVPSNSEQGACLAEIEARAAWKQLGAVAVAEIAQEV